ncbi:hypothetical protein [Amycolatopsis rifamycinica]|uniref:Uncharacterized protein n=1 Tax=Amycolatopsis rifamycinica TaxID=287986 RepID=A0A066U2F6_9PSEU|nr:hypothetical protein [Amycolatopsis rifamycinica]KDN18289.1 hypothetical protein DV20_31100 [Amycolatopsis rifamycinica]
MKTLTRFATIAAVAAGLGLVAPVAAEAGTVSVTWGCGTIGGPAGTKTFEITVTAPATATAGQAVTVHADLTQVAPAWAGGTAPAGQFTGYVVLELGGAASGRVNATGMTNPVVQPGTLFRLTGGTGQVTLPAAGPVTLATSSYVLYYSTGTFISSCGGSGAKPVAATIQVS